MTATLMAIYGPPQDEAQFTRHYFDTHLPLTKKMPGLGTFTVSRGPILGDRDDHHLIATMTFDTMQAMEESLASDEGAAAVEDLANLGVRYVKVLRFETDHV